MGMKKPTSERVVITQKDSVAIITLNRPEKLNAIDDLMRIDELRRALEDLPEDVYKQDYFERWSEAMINLLEEKGLLTREEVMGKMDALKAKLGG